MCGRDGVAGDVIITSRRGCAGKYRQAVAAKSVEWSHRLVGARVGRKREKLEAWKPRIKSSEHELMLWENEGVQKWAQASPSKKKGDLEEVWGDLYGSRG